MQRFNGLSMLLVCRGGEKDGMHLSHDPKIFTKDHTDRYV